MAALALKRKRSDSELSFGSGSMFSSPPRPFGGSSDMMATDGDAMAAMRMATTSPSRGSRSGAPAHPPGRTMKRFRDSRPSDEEVHRKFYEWRAHHRKISSSSSGCLSTTALAAERTLSLLYGARPPRPSALPAAQQQQLVPSQPGPRVQNQPSLHSFWNLPGPASPSPTVSPPHVGRSLLGVAPASCEDCGVGLGGGDSDMVMDVDDGCGAGSGCSACGKVVCFSCSVGSLGEQRHCLVCAGRKVWVGGIGWTVVPGMEVC